MRVCPFCKEEIKEDAVKCKHCHSMLYQLSPEHESKPGIKDDRTTTYVLDKDLVRFGKFALSILAIFITVGIILYGVDLKETVKDVNDANENLNAGNEKMNTAITKIDSLQTIIDGIRDSVKITQVFSQKAFEEIASTRENAFRKSDSLDKSIETLKKNAQKEIILLQSDSKTALDKATLALSEINKTTDSARKVLIALATYKNIALNPSSTELEQKNAIASISKIASSKDISPELKDAANNSLDIISQRNLIGLKPEVADLARKLIDLAKKDSITLKIISGYISKERQDSLFALGRTRPGGIVTYVRGGQTSHNKGIAFDVGIFKDGRYVHGDAEYKKLGVYASQLNLTWGGNYKAIKDYPHFELKQN